jgi:hypothetical protein
MKRNPLDKLYWDYVWAGEPEPDDYIICATVYLGSDDKPVASFSRYEEAEEYIKDLKEGRESLPKGLK